MRLQFTPSAEEDISEIWLAIATDNQAAADRAIDRIIAACNQLRALPRSARPCPEIRSDLCMLVVRPWLLPHVIEGSTVRILRVIDGRRDSSDWQTYLG